VAGSCEYGDEPSGSGATELVNVIVYLLLSFLGRVPVSPLIPFNTEFVQHGFSERAAFQGRIPTVNKGLL
jgi:hypothetical protein